ncbi:MAG: threonine synthase [Candidatus Bipolaricaulota bacterium]|nr:MAG: threonine synthase [Candidatus Bipolaricaulota bacterium]
MGDPRALRCVSCRTEYGPDELEYTCPTCGPRRGTLEFLYDYDALRSELTRERLAADGERSMWRYLPLLPIRDARFIQQLLVGWTPIYRAPALGRELGFAELLVKDDGRNPTASYKDRASSLVVIAAQEKGKEVVTCASTGNAASSLAGFAAATDLETVIFVPERAPEAKVAQLLIYGARVFVVRGSYDVAYDLAAEAADAFGWYNRSAAMNPYLVEGKKTGALELAEQLGWDLPDAVFVSVGDGSVISGVCKGFEEMRTLGWTDRVPAVIGVQAERSAPVARSFDRFDGVTVEIDDGPADTVADSICVGAPRDIVKAVTYVTRNGGRFVVVSDEEILDAIRVLARRTGVFAEPAGAAAFAGAARLARAGELKEKRVAILVTGNGLKDVRAARSAVGEPTVIDPVLARVEEAL